LKRKNDQKLQNSPAFAPVARTRRLPACGLAVTQLQYSDFCTQKRIFAFFATKLQTTNQEKPGKQSTIRQSKRQISQFCNEYSVAKLQKFEGARATC